MTYKHLTIDELTMIESKDTAARWTIKGNERHYGYKNHIAIDTKSKFVKNYQTLF